MRLFLLLVFVNGAGLHNTMYFLEIIFYHGHQANKRVPKNFKFAKLGGGGRGLDYFCKTPSRRPSRPNLLRAGELRRIFKIISLDLRVVGAITNVCMRNITKRYAIRNV